jgi:hypothetical protein
VDSQSASQWSFIAKNSTNYPHCTFTWTEAVVGNAPAKSFISGCYDEVIGMAQIASTSRFADFLTFDTLIVNKNNNLYFTFNNDNKGFFFGVHSLVSNTLTGFSYTPAPTSFETISTTWYNKGVSVFSTNTIGLFIARFNTDYSVGHTTNLVIAGSSTECCLTGTL